MPLKEMAELKRTASWVEDIYEEDPDDYVGVEIVEIELRVKDEQ